MSNNVFWPGKRILVGGGCGFLGSYLVPQLVEEGAIVTVVDNLDNGHISNLESVADQVEFIEADLRDPEVCNRVTTGKEIVINLAAKSLMLTKSHTKSSMKKI